MKKGEIPVIMYILTYLQYFSCSLPRTSLPLWPCSLAKHLVTGKEIAIELAKGIPRTTHMYVPHEATRGRGGEGRGEEGRDSCSVSGMYAIPHHTQSVLPKVTDLMLDQGIAEVGRLLGFIRLGRGGRGRGGARRGRGEDTARYIQI